MAVMAMASCIARLGCSVLQVPLITSLSVSSNIGRTGTAAINK